MHQHKFRSIRRQFIIGLAIVTSLVLIVFSSATLLFNAYSTERDLQEQMARLLSLSQESLGSAIWEYNDEYIGDYIESLFLYKDVIFVKLEMDSKTTFVKTRVGYPDLTLSAPSKESNSILNSAVIRYKDNNIGNITIGISKERIGKQILWGSLFFIALLFSLNTLVFLTVYSILRKHLFKPLEKLEKSALSIAKGNLDTVISTSGEGEIGRLALTFKQMIDQIKTVTASRDELDHEIKVRKEVETALTTSQETLMSVLNGIDATVYVADLDTFEILFMNQFMINLYGKDLKGERCHNVFADDQGPCTICTNDKLLDDDGKPTGVHIWSALNKVTGRWFMNHDRAIKWIDGRFVRLQIATDITQLKEMENELRQAHKMESIGRLAGGIAHDFNNILAAINGFSQLALETIPPDSQAAADINEVINSSDRAAKLVKQILSFSRKQQQELVPISVQSVLQEVVQLIRATLPSTIEIKAEIDPNCGAVMSDATMLHQVVMNLCTNGAQAMEYSGGILEISLFPTEIKTADPNLPDLQPGNYITLQVQDSGIGIPEDHLEHIFDPYFTTKDIGKGSGMGLAVVHGVIRNHQGDIKVESLVGKGSSFTIYLPEIDKLPAPEPEIDGELPGGKESILLVDDEKKIVELTKRRLESLGYRVTATTSSTKALEMFITGPYNYDLLVSDQTMPTMRGDELASAVKKLRPELPVIICSGYSSRLDGNEVSEMKISAFIMKPVLKSKLAKTVRECLDSHPR